MFAQNNPPKHTNAEINKQVIAEVKTEKPVKAVKKAKSQPRKKATVKKTPKKSLEVVEKPKPTPVITGNKTVWMKQAGIPQDQWVYVDYIVSRESSWNPLAVNASSGACSLAQSLPCSKIPGDWRDPVNALKWQFGYVTARYGGYAGAYNFWVANHWY